MNRNEKIVSMLNDFGVFYLATVDGQKPKVRPFGFVMAFDDKLYFATGTNKDVYKQLEKNSDFEICATSKDGSRWIRIKGKAALDSNNVKAKQKALEIMPRLINVYKSAQNPEFAVFYAKDTDATIYEMGGKTEKIS
jgi:uncharacterized pyridoxamine 5'-phosphate oxidase family protein